MVMDQKWLDMHATYMDFNVCLSFLKLIYNLSGTPLYQVPSIHDPDQIMELLSLQTVIKSTRRQLERELLLEDVKRIEDMPSYRFLAR
jgi:ELMO domain-containing protein